MMWLKKNPMCLKKGEGLIILKVIHLEFKNLFTHKPFIIDYIHLVQTKYAFIFYLDKIIIHFNIN